MCFFYVYIQNSSQYSGWSQCFSLDSFGTSSDFQLSLSTYQAFWDHSECSNYNWYHHQLALHGALYLDVLLGMCFFYVYIQNSSQYSGWSQCFSLDSFGTSSDFQLSLSTYQAFWDHSECSNYNWYHHQLALHGALYLDFLKVYSQT